MTKRYYIAGFGGLWRLSLATIRTAVTYDQIMGEARQLSVHQSRRGTWAESCLPEGIYAQEDGYLAPSSNDVEIIRIDDVEEAVAYHRTLV